MRRRRLRVPPQRPDRSGGAPLHAHARLAAHLVLHRGRGHGVRSQEPGGQSDLAAMLDWYRPPLSMDEAARLLPVLEAAIELRGVVTKALEDARADGSFTKSQEVRVKATVPAEAYALLTGEHACDLAEFYIVSEVDLEQGEDFSATVEAAHGEKCGSLLELPRVHRATESMSISAIAALPPWVCNLIVDTVNR